MNSNDNYKEWEKGFGEFLNAPEIEPPLMLSKKVATIIVSELNPSPWKVFLRLIAVVVIAGSASLLICPQLGLGSYYSPVMHFFMQLGPIGCRAACGGFFMAVSILSACFILRPEELRVLKKTRFLAISAVTSLGLGAFMCTSTEILISVALVWFIGAFIGGICSLEVGFRIRMGLLSYRQV